MRIWDLPPKALCRNHLLGEHRELHAIWVILTENRSGYRSHPETLRWVGKLAALYKRHALLVKAMKWRGYQHHSPLDARQAKGKLKQNSFVDSIKRQRILLRNKACTCEV